MLVFCQAFNQKLKIFKIYLCCNLVFLNFLIEKSKPTAIIADTIAGKGISFLEGKVKAHGKWITDEELVIAMEDLENETN